MSKLKIGFMLLATLSTLTGLFFGAEQIGIVHGKEELVKNIYYIFLFYSALCLFAIGNRLSDYLILTFRGYDASELGRWSSGAYCYHVEGKGLRMLILLAFVAPSFLLIGEAF